jgi:hypothetical protein
VAIIVDGGGNPICPGIIGRGAIVNGSGNPICHGITGCGMMSGINFLS